MPPKKVITRRQRKAAEARRQYESNPLITSPETQNGNNDAVPTGPLDVKPPCCGVKSEVKTDASAKPNATGPKSALPKQMAVGMSNQDVKATVTIIVKDKTTQSDQRVFDLLDQVVNTAPGSTPHGPPPPPLNEAHSFSKSLSRRAVATFNKIQKLSKVFNKKLNAKQPKQPTRNAGEQTDDNMNMDSPGVDQNGNKPCSCEFCKVVLNQLLAGKKRLHKKKVCKNSSSRTIKTQVDINCQDCMAPPGYMANRRRMIRMLEKKEQHKSSPTVHKPPPPPPPVKKCKAKLKVNKQTQKDDAPDEMPQKPQPPKLSRSATFDSKTKMMQSKCAVLSKSNDDEAPYDSQPPDIPPTKVIGNTGFFVIGGTDAQLAAQLDKMEEKCVHVQDTVLLQTGITDKLESQLEELLHNRQQILQRMEDKVNKLAPRRQRRTKEPSKYN